MLAAGMAHEVTGTEKMSVRTEASDDLGRCTVAARVAAGERLEVVKYIGYGWSSQRSRPALHDQVTGALALGRLTGWDGLLAEQRGYLDDFWAGADVVVDGDAEIQQAVRFGLFHILQAAARAEHRPIAAKGLTGPGYDGHTFWDTETFVLPVLTYTHPDAVADALYWRHLVLPECPQARDRPGADRGGLRVADDQGPGVLGVLAGRDRRVPHQRRHRRRHPALPGRHPGHRLRARGRPGDAGGDGAAVARARAPRRGRPVPHRRRDRARRVQRHHRQQRLHEPDGAAEPGGRRGRRGQVHG